MALNNADIAAKYYRILEQKKFLEDKSKKSIAELKDKTEEFSRVDKMARDLCETILKKETETETGSDSKNKAWAKMETPELIKKAIQSYNANDEIIGEQIKKMIELNEDRTNVITKLREQLKLAGAEDKQDGQDNEGKKTEGQAPEEDPEEKEEPDITAPETVIVEETDGETSFDEEVSMEFIDQLNQSKKRSSKVAMRKGAKRVEREKEALREKLDAEKADAEKMTETLSSSDKELIRIIGEFGYSEAKAIASAGGFSSESKLRRSLQSLEGKGIIHTDQAGYIPGMGGKNNNFHFLSETGKTIYKILYGKDAVVSECEDICREHDNVVHGYGIRNTAILLKESDYFKKQHSNVIYMNNRKGIPVNDIEHTTYVPDITIETNGRDNVYIEYELVDCGESELFRKCNKMLRVTKNLYFVVPTGKLYTKIARSLDKWIDMVKESPVPIKDKFNVYATYYDTLKTNLSNRDEEGNLKKSEFLWWIDKNESTGMVRHIKIDKSR